MFLFCARYTIRAKSDRAGLTALSTRTADCFHRYCDTPRPVCSSKSHKTIPKQHISMRGKDKRPSAGPIRGSGNPRLYGTLNSRRRSSSKRAPRAKPNWRPGGATPAAEVPLATQAWHMLLWNIAPTRQVAAIARPLRHPLGSNCAIESVSSSSMSIQSRPKRLGVGRKPRRGWVCCARLAARTTGQDK